MDPQQVRPSKSVEHQHSEGAVAWVDRVLDPVVVILLLAGLFDGLAGNPVHALVLIGAAVGLVVSAPRAGSAPVGADEDASSHGQPWWRLALPLAVAFGIVAGTFERYHWPMTFAVVVPGIAGIVIASRARWHRAPEAAADRFGVGLWTAAFVALGAFELVNFILQPDRLTASESHPTLSTLFNDIVVGWPALSAALAIWVFVGWWLVER